jgi:hypothetical protein
MFEEVRLRPYGWLMIPVAATIFAVAWPASAKGPGEAWVSGPGLDGEVVVGFATTPDIAEFVEGTRVWTAPFGRTEVTTEAPTNTLGPRYLVTYVMGARRGDVDLVQHVYPYATGGPVVYTPAGQRLWDNQRTTGGWFRASHRLTRAFLALGLPSTAAGTELLPATGQAVETKHTPGLPRVGWLAAGLGLLVFLASFGTTARVLIRRQSAEAP